MELRAVGGEVQSDTCHPAQRALQSFGSLTYVLFLVLHKFALYTS